MEDCCKRICVSCTALAITSFSLFPVGCGKSGGHQPGRSREAVVARGSTDRPFDYIEVIDASSQASFEKFATIGNIEVDRSVLSGEPRPLGENGWEASASSGESAHFLLLEPLDADKLEVGRYSAACISSFLEDGAGAVGWDQLIPPSLGNSTIWILQSKEMLGLFFVNRDEVGVAVLLSPGSLETMTIMLHGFDWNNPKSVIQKLVGYVRFTDK